MSAAVEARELTKRFGSTEALAGVSFDVAMGETFGFIGPDGGGKTTLFRILATLLVPGGGEARVLGEDVVAGMWSLRRRVGYMPGRFSLYPDLTVDENLRFFASVFGNRMAPGFRRGDGFGIIAPIYDQLAPFGDRRAGALSGGMKQKLALCCALVHRPEILLLDEPTTGVDAVSRREFWDLLGRLRAEGLTVVASTPYMDEAGRCDRVALMHRGRLLAIDTPDAVAAAYDRPLLAVRADDRRAALRESRAHAHTHSAYPFGEVLHVADARRDVPVSTAARELADFLRSRGVRGAAVEPTAPTIEDAFIARMAPASAGGTGQ